MNCEKYLNLIDDLVENELDEQTAEEINLHIFACRRCETKFQTLKREKEMYAHYLFDVEPPADLLAKFQIKLGAEKSAVFAVEKSPSTFSSWKAKLFSSFSLSPTFAMAGALILFTVSFVLVNLMSEKGDEQLKVATKDLNKLQMMLPKLNEPEIIDKNSGADLSEGDEQIKDLAKNKTNQSNLKTIVAEPISVKKSKTESPKTDFVKDIQLTDEEKQLKLIQDLELEAVKQIEKVELLLRSFRNVRFAEGSEKFDVAYEKQQARKLLANNIELRQRAEDYGTLFTEEILSKVEPYLLDIANLDSNPSSEQVLEIKERVRNQNIIASLQSF